MPAPRARRSELATPASSERMCEKAPTAGADLVFLDLEDACAPSAKEAARAIAVGALTGLDWGRTVRAVRINGIDTPWCHGDIIEVVTGARDCVDVLIVPKVRTARDVWWVDVLLGQLEAKLGLTQPHRPRGADRGRRGAGPRARDRAGERPARGADLRGGRPLGVAPGARRREFRPASSSTPVTSGTTPGPRCSPRRGRGLVDAIDAPYPDYGDAAGYRRSATAASALGFDGKWAIHPSQVPIANEVFSPTPGRGGRGHRRDRGVPGGGGRRGRGHRARRPAGRRGAHAPGGEHAAQGGRSPVSKGRPDKPEPTPGGRRAPRGNALLIC